MSDREYHITLYYIFHRKQKAMTEKEERHVRAASKILRDLNRDDVEECAAVLALEARDIQFIEPTITELWK